MVNRRQNDSAPGGHLRVWKKGSFREYGIIVDRLTFWQTYHCLGRKSIPQLIYIPYYDLNFEECM
jgi:hypothetical protein